MSYIWPGSSSPLHTVFVFGSQFLLMLFLRIYLFSTEFPDRIYASLQSSAFVESQAGPIYWLFKFIPCVSRKTGTTSQLWSIFTSVKRIFTFESCIASSERGLPLILLNDSRQFGKEQAQCKFYSLCLVESNFFWCFNLGKDNWCYESKCRSY